MNLLNATHPANQVILAHLQAQSPQAVVSQSWDAMDDWSLGTHPDVVMYFWQIMPVKLPVTCKWIICHRPALVHPDNGVIFGIAGGTDTLALRLPTPERDEALKIKKFGTKVKYPLNGTVYAKDYGDDWALVPPFDNRLEDWCLKAYNYAGTL